MHKSMGPRTPTELNYAALYLLFDLYGFGDQTNDNEEYAAIKSALEKVGDTLTSAQKSSAIRLAEDIESGYWNEVTQEAEEEFYEMGYRCEVEYDPDIREIWAKAVREKLSVEMLYDSTTSGLSRRTVDPYKTMSPYGLGYCHIRQEERKFRFDRIQQITITTKHFQKHPKQ